MFPSGQIQIGYEELRVTPNTRLVIGDIFSSFMTFHYAGSQVGEIFRNLVKGTTYAVKSDYRVKHNVKPVESGIQKVIELKPVNFNFAGYGSQDGFLAQEFAEVCSYGVKGYKNELDNDGKPVYQSMDSKTAKPILIAAIQEQQSLIQKLTLII
jgi:Chaperone of endosialidase